MSKLIDINTLNKNNEYINNKLDKKLNTSLKGANNGLAELDSSGKVPSSQLPSFVDDVIEGYLYNGKFYKESAHTTEITAESGKIYTDLSSNKTYRWGGTAYTEISDSVALGETSSTAYRGDRGKIAYDHSQAAHAPSNAQANQNAFSNVIVGSTTIAADTTTDSLTLVAGDNITLTPDATNDKITIAATDTTYSTATTSANGLMSSTDKTKLNGIATGAEVNQNAFQKVSDGTSTITAGSKTDTLTIVGSGATSVSYDTTNKKLTINSTDNNTDTKVTSVSNHYAPTEDSSSQLSADASSSTAATWNSTSLVTGVDIKRDAKGHVTGIAVDSIKMPSNPNTNTTYTLSSPANANTIVLTPSSGSPSTVTLKAGSNVTLTGTTAGEITISSSYTDTDTKVTSVDNHYSPSENTSSAISASGGTLTDIANSSSGTQVVTGLKRDAKGHVVGVTSVALKATNNTYTVNNGTLTIQKNGSNVQTFTANQSTNVTANITVPTKTSDITNDSGFITINHSHNYAGSSSAGGNANKANSVYIPRETINVNEILPGGNTWNIKETTNSSSNAPLSNTWFHMFTGQGNDANYQTQLALGMTADAVFYRRRDNQTWQNWQQIAFINSKVANASYADSAGAVAWGNISGKPSTYTPSSHTHTKSQITDFPTIPTVNNGTLSLQIGGTTKTTFTANQSGSSTFNITKDDITGLGIPGSDTNTHWTSHLYAGTSTGNANVTTATADPYLICLDDSTVRDRIQLKAGSNMSISANNGVITFTSTGNHVPTTQTANNAIFLRNDNTWQTVTPANIGAATSGHTHTTSLATDTGTSAITLAHGTKYKLTAGGSSIIFTMPSDNNTTYSAGTGISLSGTTINNSGVRSVATGSANGTISVNTNGSATDVAVKGLGSAAYTASTAYAASSHTHTASNITDLLTWLVGSNNNINGSANGNLIKFYSKSGTSDGSISQTNNYNSTTNWTRGVDIRVVSGNYWLRIAWGVVNIAAHASSVTITYPFSYSGKPVVFFEDASSTTDNLALRYNASPYISASTNTSVTFKVKSTIGDKFANEDNTQLMWLAVGYY